MCKESFHRGLTVGKEKCAFAAGLLAAPFVVLAIGGETITMFLAGVVAGLVCGWAIWLRQKARRWQRTIASKAGLPRLARAWLLGWRRPLSPRIAIRQNDCPISGETVPDSVRGDSSEEDLTIATVS